MRLLILLLMPALLFGQTLYDSGYTNPMDITFTESGDMIVLERQGDFYDNAIYVDTVSGVDTSGEGGAISILSVNNIHWIYYSHVDGTGRITYYNNGAFTEVFSDIEYDFGNHKGGKLAKYLDNFNQNSEGENWWLMIGIGDSGSLANAQDDEVNKGKILLMDPYDGTPHPDNYDGVKWAKGVRNPFSLAIDVNNNVHFGDVGSQQAEEVNLFAAPGNYGFPRYEGFEDLNTGVEIADPIHPTFAYAHDFAEFKIDFNQTLPTDFMGRSIIIGNITGNKFLFMDFYNPNIMLYNLDGSAVETFAEFDTNIVSIKKHEDEFYFTHLFDGDIFRLQEETLGIEEPEKLDVRNLPPNTPYRLLDTSGRVLQEGLTNQYTFSMFPENIILVLKLKGYKNIKFVK